MRGVLLPEGRSLFRTTVIFVPKDYFEIERLNMRSSFSLVASQQDWLA
jgi:hypothetical protein